ncbi:hypothetical protein N7478_003480 [Penicillium angulare]|uniref:uncharacterized protein n=1 Tax=Penicillium angulare TaxID=116970 RepID=UPI002541873B|nr:uncharacterized protein N7478_003480 [Penicillium angulare]KAJ5287794.1 hypothetical protein N7478_003480 [Penicillium angulare]
MRTGCVECKRRRIKCDEGKPICVRCKHRPEKCKYEFKLSWTGGRPFKNRPQTDSQSSSQSPPEAQNASASTSFPAQETDPSRKFSTVSTASTTSTASTGSGNSASSGEWVFETTTGPTAPDQGRQYSFQSENYIHQQHRLSDDHSASTSIDPAEAALAQRIPPTHANHTTTLQKSLARRYPYKKRAQIEKDASEQSNNQELSPFFQQIQYALSTNPSQLSSSPESRFFLHHYINVTADVIFPLSLTGNPLREDLLRSAMSNPHLLNAFLACACSHYARRHEGMPIELANNITKFTNASLNGLRKAMTDPKQAGKLETVSTALALCTSDVISGDLSTWRIHLSGANKLIMSAFQNDKNPSSPSKSETDGKNPLETFVIKWYALLDIFAGVSGLRKSSNSNPDGRYWSSNDDDLYIDEWTGYSLDLIPIISRIGKMARVQRKRSQVMAVNDDSDDETVDNQLREESLEEIRQMESLIYSLYNRTAHPELVNNPNPETRKRAEEMQCIHRAFLYTALLHLYRRVQDLPKYHTKAVYAVHMIIETIQMIPRESSSNILTLWPVFTVGCETDDPEQRKIIEQRISRMEAFGMGNVETARQAMHAYWESGATERWDIFLESYGQDIVLF